MNKKIFFIGTSLLTEALASWQLRLFLGPRYQKTDKASPIMPDTSKVEKIIIIKNNIKPIMLRYKHWSGTYEPTTFIITINGQKIRPNTKQNVTISNNQLDVRFNYAFLNGKRRGAKIVSFILNTNSSTLNFSFSWHDKWQVIIENATPQKVKKESFMVSR